MTKTQQKNLEEVIFSFNVEGLNILESEKNVLIDILEGKRTYQEVLSDYIAEAKAYVC